MTQLPKRVAAWRQAGLGLLAAMAFSGCAPFNYTGSDAPQPLTAVAPMQPAPRVALVLSSGGPRGYAHIGVMRVLEEAGVPAGPALTTGQVAALTDITEVSQLARIVDHAAYAPEGASSDLPAQAWTAASRIRRDLRSRMRLGRRVRAFFDPRALLRRRSLSR